MTTNNEIQKPETGPQLPRKKGGGDGDAKGTESATRHAPQPQQTTSSEATPQPGTKSRKVTSSRP
jgi:hypothetical protein